MTRFDDAALRRFEDEMVVHSQEFSPRLSEVLGEEQLRVALRGAMGNAQKYGFTNRGPIRLYIEMMFLYGSSFATDPQYPWAAQILKAPGDQMERAETLCAKILDYQEKVSGVEASNTRRALAEVQTMAKKPLDVTERDFAPGMRREMHRIFPEKAAYIGQEAQLALTAKAQADARKFGFPNPRGDALLLVLMFAFGHGCTDDPLYPWISHTLADQRIVNGTARAERLERKATTWLDHVLARPRKGGAA